MLNIFFCGGSSKHSKLFVIPCPFLVWNKLCFLGVGSLIPEGWIFGVFVGRRKQKIPCAAERASPCF